LCPSRKASPVDASLAMPTSGDFGGRGNNGKEEDILRDSLFVRLS
jgi:hypothetical protein